jgi:hypothetical protein
MPEPTRPPSAPTIPTTVAYCSWCKAYVRGARLVRQLDDEGSSFGHPGLFACEPHQAERKLTPLADGP